MVVNITYFVHGTTTDNEQGISSGWYDVALSDVGRKQSEELFDMIVNKQFDIIFASDLIRSKESAEITFGGRIPIMYDTRLRECNYGEYNAVLSSIVEPMQEVSIDSKFPGGESYEDVKNRISDFLDDVKKNYDGKRIGIVAHKAPQLALDVILKGMSRKDAFSNDRRKNKHWQPGRDYILE